MDWYMPRLGADASDDDLLLDWSEDWRLSGIELMELKPEELEAAQEALRSLAVWWSESITGDRDNFYWYEDDGYRDAEDDTRKLISLASAAYRRAQKRAKEHAEICPANAVHCGRDPAQAVPV